MHEPARLMSIFNYSTAVYFVMRYTRINAGHDLPGKCRPEALTTDGINRLMMTNPTPIENYLCGFNIGLFYDCPTVKTQHD